MPSTAFRPQAAATSPSSPVRLTVRAQSRLASSPSSARTLLVFMSGTGLYGDSESVDSLTVYSGLALP